MATFTDPSTMPKVVKDGSVQLKDSGGTNDFTVDYEDGDIGFAIGPGDLDETIVVYDRSTIAASRKGKQQPIEISFTVKLKTFTNSKTSATNPASLLDVISGTGGASAWTKVSNSHEQHNLDLTFTVEGSDWGDGADSTITFTRCIFKYDLKEGDPTKVTISAMCLGSYTVTGPA